MRDASNVLLSGDKASLENCSGDASLHQKRVAA